MICESEIAGWRSKAGVSKAVLQCCQGAVKRRLMSELKPCYVRSSSIGRVQDRLV